MNRRTLYLATAILTSVVIGLSFLAWFQGLHGSVDRYEFFPLLGLLAFALMWMHYVSGSLKRYLGLAGDKKLLKRYFDVTSMIVLVLILLHPMLLYINLFQDGFGPPPGNAFEAYTTPGTRIALVLGSTGLTAFLLFELRRWFRDRKWWKYIAYANMVAMLLIFVHGLLIGGDIISGWFRLVWILMGWLLVMSLVYNYRYDHRQLNKGDD